MKFAIIGLGGPNTFAQKLKKALMKLGHSVYLLSQSEIKNRYCVSIFKRNYHLEMKYPIDLREILPIDNYDMIIISHIDFVFNNPGIGSTKVLYYHREMFFYPSCLNPNILAYNSPHHDSFIRSYYPKLWHIPYKIDIPVAVDPEEFNPSREKDLLGLNYVSTYEVIMDVKRDYYWNYIFKEYFTREKKFTENGCRYNGDKFASFDAYKDYLERSEAFLFFTGPGMFGSRRIVEIAACKTLPVIHIESEASEEYHNKLEFEHLENCIMFRNFTPKTINYDNYKEMVNNAYDLVVNNHTYDCRANQIIKLLQ